MQCAMRGAVHSCPTHEPRPGGACGARRTVDARARARVFPSESATPTTSLLCT